MVNINSKIYPKKMSKSCKENKKHRIKSLNYLYKPKPDNEAGGLIWDDG
jgi:hypothetical protein